MDALLMRSLLAPLVIFPLLFSTVQTTPPSRWHASTAEAVYVIGMAHCTERWRLMQAWAASRGLPITFLNGTPYGDVRLHHPPLPIVNMPTNTTVHAGQVACTASHIRVWQEAFARNLSRVLVLEDDVRMTDALLARLPAIMADVEHGRRMQGERAWHYLFLRVHSIQRGEQVRRPSWFGQVAIARPGWGTAAYMLSWEGIRFLLTRVTAYSYPLDVQLERFQRGFDSQGAEFVALDACAVAERERPRAGCPENVREISRSEKGECYFSGTQAGKSLEWFQAPRWIKV